jgi:hypothetical protein
MTYQQAAEKHNELSAEVERINSEAKKKTSELKKIINDIENWFAVKAQEEGLKTIPTTVGTVYWSSHYSASVAEPQVFKDYVIQNNAFDLMEVRAAKLAVKSYIEGHGEPPPGVNFSSRKVFNLRKTVKE